MDKDLFKKIKQNWDNLAKPIDGLGEFETVLSRIGAIQGNERIALSPATLLVFISDNGIIEEGVSQTGCEVTYEVAKALGKNMSTVSHMAKQAGVTVLPVNVGIKTEGDLDGVDNKCIRRGTNNFLKEPAMTEDEMEKAINIGRLYVKKLKEDGVKLILLGEMGIGNTTTSAAVLASILHTDGETVCSLGAGLSSEGLRKKVRVVDSAIDKYGLYEQDALTVLRTVGGFDIAALTGTILEAVEQNIPVVSDGLITGVAALIASRINSDVKDGVIFSHCGREKGMPLILQEFEAKPVIGADMALGEGTGACIFVSAAKCALSVYEGNTLFDDINIESYKRLK